MSRRKHSFTVTSFADLAKAFPLAVTEKVIPEKREQKADYAYIAKLLDCKIAVPGIEISPTADDTTAETEPVEVPKEKPPAFLRKHHDSGNGV